MRRMSKVMLAGIIIESAQIFKKMICFPIVLVGDGYYVAYKPITRLSILFMFVEMKFIHCHSCVMFAMKSMSMCND